MMTMILIYLGSVFSPVMLCVCVCAYVNVRIITMGDQLDELYGYGL